MVKIFSAKFNNCPVASPITSGYFARMKTREEGTRAVKRFGFGPRLRRHFTLRCLIATSAVFFHVSQLLSQDTHYWSTAYGTHAQLLGGLVVGSSSDMSSTYYNPGALALSKDSALILSTLSLGISTLKFELDLPEPVTVESNVSGPAPTIFALRLPFSVGKGNVLAFSYLGRRSVRTDLNGFSVRGPAEPARLVDITIYTEISESWYGVSWASRMSQRTGVGITLYVAPVTYRQRLQSVVEGSNGALSGAIGVRSENFYFNNFRLLAKAGLYWSENDFSFGLTVTTPSLGLFNTSGWLAQNSSLIVTDTSGSTVSLDAFRSEDLSSEYRSPFSIAVGGAFEVGNTIIHAGAEWFAPVAEYAVMQAGGDSYQSTAQTLPPPLKEKRNAVLNLGVGALQKLGPVLSLYGAVTTDRSYKNTDTPSSIGISDLNLVRISGGIALSIPQLDVTTGVSYGFGRKNSDLGSPTLVGGLNQGPTVRYQSTLQQLVVLVGLTLKLT